MSEPLEPAFPRDHRYEGHNGLTMRDYFAAKALAGILANSEAANGGAEPMLSYLSRREDGADWVASMSYQIADAMLEARK
ncbi:hypothetical protein CAL26_05010 [Bordetella genomosp. 9]|uniref:Uncharacterized protein n=1 Tax=Bordetella genomosp. 9 TaxID=1416803 RepID=A0A261RQX3_9BORD|nr:hypothetical protein [Bordetella genomosp. 9]OZI26683.1 hypothetical protein CAL26_05010 [Bordetella genomosp. 9]